MKYTIAAILILFSTGATMANENKAAIFAGGCFWCMETEFTNIPGVINVMSGYIGGKTVNPTYEQVSTGTTGHLEAIMVNYNPNQVSYTKLLDIFWENVDPLDPKGQFCDKGSQYLAGIFTMNDEQKKQAEASKESIAKKFGKPIATIIKPASKFYPAEEYHQDFYIKSEVRYKSYINGCGRDARLKEIKGMIK